MIFCIGLLFLVTGPRDEAPGVLNEHDDVQREQPVLLLGDDESQPDELVADARKPGIPLPANHQLNADDGGESYDPVEVLKQPVQSSTAGAIMIWRSAGVAASYSAKAASHRTTDASG